MDFIFDIWKKITSKFEELKVNIKIKILEKYGKETSGLCVDENYRMVPGSGGMQLVLTIQFTDDIGEQREHIMYYPDTVNHNCKFTRDARGTYFKVKYLPRMTEKVKFLHEYKFPYVICVRLMQKEEIE